MQKFVDLKGFADEVARAALDGFDRVLHRAVAGDDDCDDVGIAVNGGFHDRRTIDARQTQVGEDDVEGEISELRHGNFPRLGLLHVVAPVAQLFGDGLTQRSFVFNEENMSSLISHLQCRQYFDT